MTRRVVAGEEDGLRHAFSVFDEEKTGHLTATNLFNAFERLGEPRTLGECEAMIQAADSRGKGYVGYADFKSMMTVH